MSGVHRPVWLFYISAGDLNLDPHGCMAGPLEPQVLSFSSGFLSQISRTCP